MLLRTQGIHPFNPEGFDSATWDMTFNTTSSFITNTNWQYYGGETTMSYFSQMAGLAVQNFISAGGRHLGGDRRDPRLRRALGHVARQLLAGPHAHAALRAAADLLRRRPVPRLPGRDPERSRGLRARSGDQTLALGPVASQEVIKMLGTNGGGFFNVNSAMPFENPTGLSNFVEMLLILMIPAGLTADVRPLRRQPPPGLGPLRRDAR